MHAVVLEAYIFSLTHPLECSQLLKFCIENFANTSYMKRTIFEDWSVESENIKRLQNRELK